MFFRLVKTPTRGTNQREVSSGTGAALPRCLLRLHGGTDIRS